MKSQSTQEFQNNQYTLHDTVIVSTCHTAFVQPSVDKSTNHNISQGL